MEIKTEHHGATFSAFVYSRMGEGKLFVLLAPSAKLEN